MSLCKYKHIFGKEKEGLHSVRVFDIAMVDLLLTLLLGCILSYYFKFNLYITWLFLLLTGIIIHRLFCVNSTINVSIFGKV